MNGRTAKVVILLQCIIIELNYIKVYKGATTIPSGDSRVKWQTRQLPRPPQVLRSSSVYIQYNSNKSVNFLQRNIGYWWQ